MANTNTIAGYTLATTIDPVKDLLLIENFAATTYRSINRNVLLGLTSQPVGISDTQTLTNKTLTSPTIAGATLSGTLSGTYTIGGTPTFPSSVVTLTNTQTLTNKTLTSPIINGGSIDNATITVDSISGHTTSTIVTVGGVQMNNGTISTSGAVTSTSIAAGAVQPNALITGTGTGWATSSFSPGWTNLTVSGSTVTGKYIQMGKLVYFRITVVLGGSNVPSGSVSFTLPTTSVSYAGTTTVPPLGIAKYFDVSAGGVYTGDITWQDTTHGNLHVFGSDLTFVSSVPLSATVPFTWTNTDELDVYGFYESA